jgi:hypothetical protein
MSDVGKVAERILFNRRVRIGRTKEYGRHPVYLEAIIKEKVREAKRNTDLKPVKNYKTLSIMGHSKNFGGQIYDELNEKNIDFEVPKQRVDKIKSIWKQWHLNDLKAGTKRQEKALAKMGGVNANKYDEQVNFLKKKRIYNDKGYKFGTSWLVEELPNDVEKEVMRLF